MLVGPLKSSGPLPKLCMRILASVTGIAAAIVMMARSQKTHFILLLCSNYYINYFIYHIANKYKIKKKL